MIKGIVDKKIMFGKRPVPEMNRADAKELKQATNIFIKNTKNKNIEEESKNQL